MHVWCMIVALTASLAWADESKAGDDCCYAITIDSDGGTLEYQWTRLGTYLRDGTSDEGKPRYKKTDGTQYIWFIAEGLDVWYVGENGGGNGGGMINKDGQSACPGNLLLKWEYYNWGDENGWALDDTLTVTCDNGYTDPPPTTAPAPTPPHTTSGNYESCTWGSWCDDCAVYAESGGVRYCCANDCNSGGININVNGNGGVDCTCYH